MMKKSNGHFLKGTVKRVCGALALAAVLAVTPVIFDGCQNQTGMEQNGQKEYDANGWNKHDPNDLINGITKTIYDNEGYNRAGYDQYGWNRDDNHISGNPYDENGFKRDGKHYITGTFYGQDGYDREGYDEDGWHRDPANLINKHTGREYDLVGYDRAGWNTFNTSDKMNKNGTLYDATGHDRDGNEKPAGVEDIPAFGFDSSTTDVEYFERFGFSNQYSLALITTSELGTGQDAFNSLEGVTANLLPKGAAQVQNLKDGYTTVADKYQDIDIFSKLAAAENQNLADIVFDGSNIDAILNAIFGDANSSEKSAFAADLAVYQKGNYFLQKQRFSSVAGSGSTEPTKADLTNDIKDLLDDPNFNTNGITQIAETAGVVTNMSTILGDLEARMLNQMNTAMGVVDETPVIANGTNRARIRELNIYLLNQIGEDRGQFDALFDDIDDLDLSTINKTNMKDYFSDNYSLTMGPQKAGQLNNDFNFNLEYLKPKENEIATRMV
jgi:hypothetical protein